MAEFAEQILKRLQQKCWRALCLYADLTETTCGMMLAVKSAPLGPADRARLARLRRQENAAQAAYMKARMDLMIALSVPSLPGDDQVWRSLNADPEPPEPAPLRPR